MSTHLHQPVPARDRITRGASDNMPEHELIAAAQAGVVGAIDALFISHRIGLYRAARRFSSRPEDIDDLVQETMLRAFMKIRTFRGEAQFSTWLTTILNNSAISRKRRKAVQWVYLDDDLDQPSYPVMKDLPDSRRTPEQEAILGELLLAMREALDRRSGKDQQVLVACVLDEVSVRDYARQTDASVASVKSRLFRARRGLSESFRRRGIVRRRSNATHCRV